jgi:hypothetical protein
MGPGASLCHQSHHPVILFNLFLSAIKLKTKENSQQISPLKIFLLFSKPNAACHILRADFAAFIRIPDLPVEFFK